MRTLLNKYELYRRGKSNPYEGKNSYPYAFHRHSSAPTSLPLSRVIQVLYELLDTSILSPWQSRPAATVLRFKHGAQPLSPSFCFVTLYSANPPFVSDLNLVPSLDAVQKTLSPFSSSSIFSLSSIWSMYFSKRFPWSSIFSGRTYGVGNSRPTVNVLVIGPSKSKRVI